MNELAKKPRPNWMQLGLAVSGGLIVGALVVAAWQGARPGADRKATEAIVREYILAHPEILPEAMAVLQSRETKKQVDANRAVLETPFAGAWAGAKDGDVVLVEFFDYACGYCKASLPHIERLLAEDKKLKVVFRELPILSPQSEVAARASLAAAEQGKFEAFHSAMYEAGRPSPEAIAAVQGQAGLDPRKAAVAMESVAVRREIEGNLTLARSLGATGTPTWVVGDRILNGAVGYDELKRAVAAARDGTIAD